MKFRLLNNIRPWKGSVPNKRTGICHSVDPKMFIHTLAPTPKQVMNVDGSTKYVEDPSPNTRLLTDFHHYFPSLDEIKTVDQIRSLVGMNNDIRDWYKLWSLRESQATSFPNWLDKDSSADLEAFELLERDRQILNTKNKAWNDRIRSVSDTLKATIKTVESEKNAYMSNIKPLHAINLISIVHLPVEDQAKLALVDDKDERDKLSSELVLNYQRKLKTDYDKGIFTNPFLLRG